MIVVSSRPSLRVYFDKLAPDIVKEDGITFTTDVGFIATTATEYDHIVVVDVDYSDVLTRDQLADIVLGLRLFLLSAPGMVVVCVLPQDEFEEHPVYGRLQAAGVQHIVTDMTAIDDDFWTGLCETALPKFHVSSLVYDLTRAGSGSDNWLTRMVLFGKIIEACHCENSVEEVAKKVLPPTRYGCRNPGNAARQKLHQKLVKMGAPNAKDLIVMLRVAWALKLRSLGMEHDQIATEMGYQNRDAYRSSMRTCCSLSLQALDLIPYKVYLKKVATALESEDHAVTARQLLFDLRCSPY